MGEDKLCHDVNVILIAQLLCFCLFLIQVPCHTVCCSSGSKGWNDQLLKLVMELGLTESLPVQYMSFFYHWNKKLWYFSCDWIFLNSWLMTNIYPTSPCAFTCLLRLTFMKQQRVFFFHYYIDSLHKIDIVTVTEANKYCANLVSLIDALTSVYVFVTLH